MWNFKIQTEFVRLSFYIETYSHFYILCYGENNATNKPKSAHNDSDTLKRRKWETHLLTKGYYFKAYVHIFTKNVNGVERYSTAKLSMQLGSSEQSQIRELGQNEWTSEREKECKKGIGGYVIRCTIDAAKQHVP